MAKTVEAPELQAVTANDLRSGAVVFLTHDGGWTTEAAAAAIAGPEASQALLAEAERQARENRVIAPYLIAVDEAARPLRLRERIRAAGPSVAHF
ncbi:MAG: DUF2849 domain-containing protein [Thalassobaculales bacterium]